MKKKKNITMYVVIGGILAYFLLFRNKANAQTNNNTGGGPVNYNSSCTSNCQTYVGVLAGQNITMKLTGQSTSITGDYVYNTIGLPIQLQETSRGAGITVRESYNNATTGNFLFNMFSSSSTTVTGTWTSPDGARTYNFTLTKV